LSIPSIGKEDPFVSLTSLKWTNCGRNQKRKDEVDEKINVGQKEEFHNLEFGNGNITPDPGLYRVRGSTALVDFAI
jgi:hypothetical protein